MLRIDHQHGRRRETETRRPWGLVRGSIAKVTGFIRAQAASFIRCCQRGGEVRPSLLIGGVGFEIATRTQTLRCWPQTRDVGFIWPGMAVVICLTRHHCQRLAHNKFRRGEFLNIGQRDARREFFENQAVEGNANYRQFGNDGFHDANSG
jgi:hypothetical protein